MQARPLPLGSIGLVLLTGALSSGCVTYRGTELGGAPTEVNVSYQTFDDFTLWSQLPRDAAQIEGHFDRNLLELEVIPVEINMFSTSTAANFHVDPKNVTLKYDDGTELARVTADEVFELARFSHWRALPAWIFILPGFLTTPSIFGANDDMLADYRDKELQLTPLIKESQSARSGLKRVIYFKNPGPVDLDDLKRRGELSAIVDKYEGDSRNRKTLTIIFGTN